MNMKTVSSVNLSSSGQPNTACTRLVGVCAFFKPLPGLEFSPAPKPGPRPAHLRLTHTVGQLPYEFESAGAAGALFLYSRMSPG